MYVYVVGFGTPPPPLPQASVPPPPEPKGGGGAQSPAGGIGGVPITTTGESLALCPLCGWYLFLLLTLSDVHVPCNLRGQSIPAKQLKVYNLKLLFLSTDLPLPQIDKTW